MKSALFLLYAFACMHCAESDFDYGGRHSEFSIIVHKSSVLSAYHKVAVSFLGLYKRVHKKKSEETKKAIECLIYNWRDNTFGFDRKSSNILRMSGLIDFKDGIYFIPSVVASFLTLRVYRKKEKESKWAIDIFPTDIATFPISPDVSMAVKYDESVVPFDAKLLSEYGYYILGPSVPYIDIENLKNDIYRIHVPMKAKDSFLKLLQEFKIQEDFLRDVLIQERPYRK
jgi:hypothetical protein